MSLSELHFIPLDPHPEVLSPFMILQTAPPHGNGIILLHYYHLTTGTYTSYALAPSSKIKCGFRLARSRIVTANTPLAHANQLRVY